MSFYDTYVRLCRARGLSPCGAATAAGISKSAPGKWKNSTPNGETLVKLSKFFDVPISYFSGVEEPEVDLSAYPELLRIARAGAKMSKEKRSELLNYAKYLVPEAFDD